MKRHSFVYAAFSVMHSIIDTYIKSGLKVEKKIFKKYNKGCEISGKALFSFATKKLLEVS